MKSHSLAAIGFSGIIAEGLKSVLTGSRFKLRIDLTTLAELFRSAGGSELNLSAILIDTDDHPPLQSSDLDEIRRRFGEVKIILMVHEGRFYQIMNVACEADGVVLASGAGPALLQTLDLVLLGQRVYPAGLFQSMRTPDPVTVVNDGPVAPVPGDVPNIGTLNGFWNALRNLSEREVQVVNLLSDGSPNKIIARKLGISEATVKVHVKAILRKTRARNRTEAAILFSSAVRPDEVRPEPFMMAERTPEHEGELSESRSACA